jgi:hypothetical protein
LKTILISLIFPAQLLAQVVFSEVLYNEPEARVNLEWVEIYNWADTAVDLQNYVFISENDTTSFVGLTNAIVQPGRYAVLARRLTAIDSSDSFEGHWGDSSGYWGDAPNENYRAYQAKMNLSNISGAVYLVNIYSGESDQCFWDEPAGEGQSLERDRAEPPSGTWHLSTEPAGSTPGRANSERLSPSTGELITLSSKIISPNKGERLQIEYVVPAASRITLEIFDDSGHIRTTLLDKASTCGQIGWDGRAGNGSPLPPGIYMILMTLSGIQNDSKCIPVVIAP